MKLKVAIFPRSIFHLLKKDFREAMVNGPLAGFPLDSLKVVLKDGSFHPVDSDALSFEIAAKHGIQEICRQMQSCNS